MIAETMAGIALVKGAVDGIKNMIGTANDVSEIAGYIDKLFEGEKQVQQQRNKKAGVDNFGGIGGVASEVIDARLAAEKLQEVASLVDMRFGHGTWKSILDERSKRLREEKERIAALKKAQRIKAQEREDLIKQILIAGGCIIVVIFIIIAMAISVSRATIN
jgi:hypothetical protein